MFILLIFFKFYMLHALWNIYLTVKRKHEEFFFLRENIGKIRGRPVLLYMAEN